MAAYIKTDNRKRIENSRIWMKSLDKYRIEQITGAQKIITIANGRDVWEIRTLDNTCLHSKETAEQVTKVGKQTAQTAEMAAAFRKEGGKPAGAAKIDGVRCAVFRKIDKTGLDHRIWVLPDGRIRRMLSTGTQRGAIALGEPIETHTLESRVDFKWLPGNTIDEALFRPPAGMTVTDRPATK